ncbi:MAG: hypothetical protein MPN21_12055 [Thermoanaerobaculia bacterium]|nr:hypothetical protein [Thermoanaerobaculia bacterium]
MAFAGEVFGDQARLETKEGGLEVLLADHSQLVITLPSSTVDSGEAGFRSEIVELDVLPGQTVEIGASMTLVLDGDEAPERSRLEERLQQIGSLEAEQRQRWQLWLSSIDTGRDPSDPLQILAVKSLQTLVNNWRSPVGRMRHGGLFSSSNVWYFNGFWAWDSWKHAVALVLFHPQLAKDQVRLMFEHQNEAGMIADVVYLDAEEDNRRDTKPPLAGWAIETIYEATGDLDFVAELYPTWSAITAGGTGTEITTETASAIRLDRRPWRPPGGRAAWTTPSASITRRCCRTGPKRGRWTRNRWT